MSCTLVGNLTTHPPRVVPCSVVAVVVEWRGRIALLKRSQHVLHDKGKWHCVTGYIEDGRDPAQQALDELYEETGLRLVDLTAFEAGPVLPIEDACANAWPVHTFRAETTMRRLTINWEHDTYRWTPVHRVNRFHGRVDWLDTVIHAVGGP